ncbi:MAG: hypothetical protein KDB03_22820 [Planctomycetales bacterium]|nr:hypothetical protein [Planctomycetales bacterium]
MDRERSSIAEIDERFTTAALKASDFPDQLLDPISEKGVLRDNSGYPLEVPCNYLYRMQASGLRQTDMRFIVKNLPALVAHLRGETFSPFWRSTWVNHQEYQLMELIRRFFDGGEHAGLDDRRSREFGQASLVFARRTKEHRDLEFPGLQQTHDFLHSATVIHEPIWPMSPAESDIGERLRFPLFRLLWKQRPGACINRRGNEAPLSRVCYRINLQHGGLPRRVTYSESRWTVTERAESLSESAQNRQTLQSGKIPLLSPQADRGLFWNETPQTVMISLMRYQHMGAAIGENLTIELDPRTLEVISIRQYLSLFAISLAIGGAFDLPFLAKSVEDLFWS